MAARTLDLSGAVHPGHEFDVDSLLLYLRSNVIGFPLIYYKFSVSQFGYGQSNPTFLVEVKGAGLHPNRYVVRKKPPGKLLQSAHAIEREFQVLRALGAHSNVAVPKVFCLCTDPGVIGTPFYVMEFLDGRIFLDGRLPCISPDSRRSIYLAMADALASLHSVDIDTAGLGKLGKRHDYCKRQIERWGKQYIASTTQDGKPGSNPKMFKLIDWLRKNIPLEDSTGASGGLVHGDIKLDNVIFHPTEDRVIGILDWELCTIGNQMCDVAYSCLNYIVDIGLKGVKNYGLELTGLPEGIPSLPEYLGEYSSKSISPWPQANWKFYVAFSLFRAASIYAGVYYRWIMGNASGGDHAELAGKKANDFVDSAWEFIERRYVLPEHPPSVSRCTLKQYDDEMEPLDFKEQGNVGHRWKVLQLRKKLIWFMEEHILPLENEFHKHANSSKRWTVNPKEEKLKVMARREGLWNLFIPVDSAVRARELLPELGDFPDLLGSGLSNFEYGFLCEIMGRSLWAPQIFNCGPPDTGNIEVLLRYGNKEQLQEWLIPLLEGKIRSGFAMTEPSVSSSDATNIECSILREGDFYVINGTKWWTSGAMDPRCKLLIVMGKTDFKAPKHKQQSMVLVDSKADGIHIKRHLTVFGFDDAPHGHAEILFQNVRVPTQNLLLGEGRGFEIAQGRLGPGRLHHCMRLVGAAERAMQTAVYRAVRRRAFGKWIAEHGSFRADIAKCRVELEQTRLLVQEAARRLDREGNVKARGALAMAKVGAPKMALGVLDMAIQVHGAAGLSSDTVLSQLWASARALRIADGPDEVHLSTIAKLELSKAKL